MARPAHRPTLFTPDAQIRYLEGAAEGLHPELCRKLAGWAKSTALMYLARGDSARERALLGENLSPEDSAFADFLDRVEKAQAEWVLEKKRIIRKAAESGERGAWLPAAWDLERCLPNLFGRRYVEHSGPDGGRIPIEVTADEVLGQLRELAAGGRRGGLRALPPPPEDVDVEVSGNGTSPDG